MIILFPEGKKSNPHTFAGSSATFSILYSGSFLSGAASPKIGINNMAINAVVIFSVFMGIKLGQELFRVNSY